MNELPNRMVTLTRWLALLGVLALTSPPSTAVHAELLGQDKISNSGYWVPGYQVNGINDIAEVMCEYEGQLIVGGLFASAGTVRTHNIAAFDGQDWSELGTGAVNSVKAMVVYEGKLVVGGDLSRAGDQDVRSIAAWDGETWEPLGSGLNRSVRALAVYNGDLIVAGTFTEAGGIAATSIARWDGAGWHPMGDGLAGGTPFVYALTVFDGKLIAAGSFSLSGGTPVQSIAQWDGHSWTPLGYGVNGTIFAMEQYHGNLIVGGSFNTVGGSIPSDGLASWNGTTWSSLPLELGPGEVGALALLAHGNNLFVGGLFREVNQEPVGSMFSWDGQAVGSLFGGVSGSTFPEVDDFIVFQDEVYASGGFVTSEGRPVFSIAVLRENGWQPVSPGLGFNRGVSDLLEFEGTIIAAGDFKYTGVRAVDRVAQLEGEEWLQLGDGLNNSVRALTLFQGKPVAVGFFTAAGSTPVDHIATWNGSEWSPLGSGLNGPVATCLSVGDSMFVGGSFSMAGGVPANNVAVWDGNQWHPMGAGFDSPVLALETWGGTLVAGGDFRNSGAVPTMFVAHWDGTTWLPLGGGPNGPVYALASFQNMLIAGGSFSQAGGNAASAVAQWDGASWSNLGSGIDIFVNALEPHGSNLIAGGFFQHAGGFRANHIAQWNGVTWSAMGAGIDWEVFTLLSRGSELWVGGLFGRAGSARSSNIAVWRETPTPVLVSNLSASWAQGMGVLSYELEGYDGAQALLHIQRSTHPEGPYEAVSTILVTTSGSHTYVDRSAPQGTDIWYRICIAEVLPPATCSAPVRLNAHNGYVDDLISVSIAENNQAQIRFSLASTGSHVRINVFDVRGRRVRQVFDGVGTPGVNIVHWNLTRDNGVHVPRGVYFVRLVTSHGSFTRRFPLIHPTN